jgi:hypothetical protein
MYRYGDIMTDNILKKQSDKIMQIHDMTGDIHIHVSLNNLKEMFPEAKSLSIEVTEEGFIGKSELEWEIRW